MFVHHIDRFRDSVDLYFADLTKIVFDLTKYTKVAEVETTDMDEAFRLTNHITHNWTENQGVTSLKGREVRSTSVGDIIEHDGRFYVVASVGFEEIKTTGASK
jgi:hypothetical protein